MIWKTLSNSTNMDSKKSKLLIIKPGRKLETNFRSLRLVLKAFKIWKSKNRLLGQSQYLQNLAPVLPIICLKRIIYHINPTFWPWKKTLKKSQLGLLRAWWISHKNLENWKKFRKKKSAKTAIQNAPKSPKWASGHTSQCEIRKITLIS